MRVIMAPIGSSGDVHPFLAVARELKAHGHDVRFLANSHYRPQVEHEGIELVVVGEPDEFRRVVDDPDLWHPRRGVNLMMNEVVLKLLRTVRDAAADLHLPGETVLCGPPMALGLRLLQEQLGVPLVSVLLQPSLVRSVPDPPVVPGLPFRRSGPLFWNRFCWWLIDALGFDRMLGRGLNAYRRELGLPPVRRISRWWVSPQRSVGLFPEWFCPRVHELGPTFACGDFPGYDEREAVPMPPEVEAFLAAGEPPIVCTFGTVMVHGKKLFAAAADACRRLGRRAILLTKHAAQLPQPLPVGTIHADYVPLSRLLPRCAALVHHGGIGTLSQGIAAGKPQVVVPLAFDQFDNIDRLERLGLGARAAHRGLTGASLAAALQRVLSDPSYAANAESRSRLLQPARGPAAVREAIEALGTGGKRG